MTTTTAVLCLICQQPLSMRLSKGRKSGKVFVMLLCSVDARHFRAFINDRTYVDSVLVNLEDNTPSSSTPGDADTLPTGNCLSKIVSEAPNS